MNIPRHPALSRLLGAAALGLALALTACDKLSQGMQAQQQFRGQNVTGAAEGKGFALPDSRGVVRQLQDFSGKVVVLFFGFTQCPDVCPTSLAQMATAKALLGEQGQQMQVIFVTVDPERDTPEILSAYMAAFDTDFIALLPPTDEALRQIAKDFKVFYKRVPTGSSYTVDHTAQGYIFDTQGRLRLLMRHDMSAEDYAHDIRQLLQQAPA